MKQRSPQESDAEIGKYDDERSNHPTCQFIPMSPTCSEIKYANQRVGLLEELVSSQPNSPTGAENVQKRNHDLRNNAPDNVLLFYESGVSLWLWLVESAFHKCPDQSMQERLDENDSTGPAMQKVEVLVWDTGDKRQDAFTRAKGNGEWCQGISQSPNTIAPTTEACSDCFQFGMLFGRRDPGLVSDTDEAVLESACILSTNSCDTYEKINK